MPEDLFTPPPEPHTAEDEPALPGWQPFFRAFYTRTDRRSAQVTRVHLMAPPGLIRRNRGRRYRQTAVCGVTAWGVRQTAPVRHDLGQPLPAGLSWCPVCLGRAADHLGLRDQLAELVLPRVRQELTTSG